MKELFYVVLTCAYVVLALVIVLGAFRYKAMPISLKFFFLYLFGIGFIELTSELCIAINASNLWLLHYLTIHEFLFLGLTYVNVFSAYNKKRKPFFRTLHLIGLLLVIIMQTASIFGFMIPFQWDVVANAFVHLSMVGLSSAYLYKVIINTNEDNNPSFFWINAGILCFFASTLISDLFFNKLFTETPKVALSLWLVNIIISIAFYLVGGYAFFKSSRQVS